MERLRALVVGGESAAHESIRHAFSQCNVDSRWVRSKTEAIEVLRSDDHQILLVDFATPDVEPVEFVRFALGLRPAPVVIGMASAEDAERGTEFVRAGGYDVISTSPRAIELGLLVERAGRQLEQFAELQRLRHALQSREGYDRLVGRSEAMQRLRDRLERLSSERHSIWISGEEGTGKELTARSIHAASNRADLPFVVVDCATGELPAWLLETTQSDPFLVSGGGTLFLEHIDALSLRRQERLHRALTRLAERDEAQAVRCIAGAPGDARRQIERGALHEPLYRDLSATTILLPPLRDRREDIPLLARHFITSIVQINRLAPIQIASDAVARLQSYRWPGNIQQLRGAIEHAVILASDGSLRAADLPDWVQAGEAEVAAPDGGPTTAVRRFREAKREVVDTFERAYLRTLLQHHAGNVTAAASEAGMLRSALQRLLRKHGLKSASFRTLRSATGRAEHDEIGLD